jgi:hypothetical protein
LALVACDAFEMHGEQLPLGDGPDVTYGYRWASGSAC